MAIACTPADLVNAMPSLRIASETQLDMLWFYLWAYFGGHDVSEDLDELLAAGVPYMALADRQMKEAKVALFADLLGVRDLSLQEILDDLECVNCTNPKLIRAATLALICEFFNAWS